MWSIFRYRNSIGNKLFGAFTLFAVCVCLFIYVSVSSSLLYVDERTSRIDTTDRTIIKVLDYTSNVSTIMKTQEPYMTNNTYRMTNPDQWVILLTVNNGYFDMFQNWWVYFKKLDINVSIVVIAEDEVVFEKLKVHVQYADSVKVLRSWILNISKSLEYNSKQYNRMVSTRPSYILKFLEDGDNVLYSDVDTVWLRSPFKFFQGLHDMWTQSEEKALVYCTGFMAIKSNENTIQLLKDWINVLNKKLQKNQPPFNKLLRTKSSVVRVFPLDETKFAGKYELAVLSKEQMSAVVMIHATFCFGHTQKRECLLKWKVWKV